MGLDAEINKMITVFGDYTVQAGQSNYFGQSVQAGVKVGF
jgi:outer membrane autotransporter protein